MSNSVFDFLNFDFSELLQTMKDLKMVATDKYNDFVNNNIKKYDLNTEEGYEAFIKEAADIRTQLVKSDNVFANKLVDLLDGMVERAMKNHSEKVANKQVSEEKKVDELVKAEVKRNIHENHGKLNTGKNYEEKEERSEKEEEKIDWPSNKLTAKQRRNVQRLVDEYMDTKVVPYLDEEFDEDTVDDMSSGLFEFAAWILTKEE